MTIIGKENHCSLNPLPCTREFNCGEFKKDGPCKAALAKLRERRKV